MTRRQASTNGFREPLCKSFTALPGSLFREGLCHAQNITIARAATGCGAGVWTAKFHANTTFKGDPKKTACDTLINEN
jgi:hypothetical protein